MLLPNLAESAARELERINAEKLRRDRELAEAEAARAATAPPTPEERMRRMARESLMAFVPWATPTYGEPQHLKPIVEAFERAVRGESIRMCFSAPPQNAKSDTLAHGVAWGLWNAPGLRFGYATYGDALVRDKSKLARRLVQERLGMPLDVKKLTQWDTPEDGGFVATSVRGALTGKRINIAIIDDPYKNRPEAESPTIRRTVRDFMNDVVETRLTPNGSCFVFMARWHPQDLIGELIDEGWEYVRLQALNDETGEPLWPEVWTREALERKRIKVGEYTWESLYQGRPRPRGAAIFGPPTTYRELPKVFTVGGGLDLAYSTRTSADRSIAVRGVREANGDRIFITDVIRRHGVSVTDFRRDVHALHVRGPSARWRWYTSTTEKGAAQMFREPPELAVPVIAITAAADKHTRALPTAAAWNAGNVLVPENAPWLDDFLAVVLNFTGADGADDDDVDALVAMHDELMAGGVEVPVKPRKPRRTGLGAMDL